MIRGNLRLLTLKALDKKPLSGYALMKYIEAKIGTKPSPGSIYPLLDELEKENRVSCNKDGRKKVYTLTRDGKEQIKEADANKELLLKKTEESINICAEMTGQDIAPFKETMDALKKGKYSIEELPHEVAELKAELARIFNGKLFRDNRKKVKEILQKTAGELRKIK